MSGMSGLQNLSVIPGYAGGTINTDTDTSGGITIDTQGYGKVGFALHAGTVTAGVLDMKITETDNSDGTTGAAEVTSGYTVQQQLTASNTVKKIEAPVGKRYVRLHIVSSSSANIVVKGAVAILSDARNAPVA